MTLAASVFPEKLREYLAANECVAFVGAGFSIPCGMPTWSKLLADLLEEAAKSVTGDSDQALLADSLQALEARQFQTAASGVRELLGKEQLKRHLTGAFDAALMSRLPQSKRTQMLDRLENLVRGPWAGIITTNFDTLIESGFDRFLGATRPFRCDGSHNSLGSVLCLPRSSGGFFVKLHGDMWADLQVLSTADYVQAWLTSPRVRHFLAAVMLRYRVVFIGCSLEDAVLQLRLRLWADFGKALPRAYALLPDTSANRLRRRELKEEAGLESLLYPIESGSGAHYAVDEFLRTSRGCSDVPGSSFVGPLGTMKGSPVSERIEAIGAINRHLLAVICAQMDGRLRYSDVFDPYFDQIPQGESRHALSSLSEAERIYRLLFLVALGLATEHNENGHDYFHVSEEVRQYLTVPG
jgi:hypothetical protein